MILFFESKWVFDWKTKFKEKGKKEIDCWIDFYRLQN